MQLIIRWELVKRSIDLRLAEAPVGKIEDRFPILGGERMTAGAEIHAEILRRAE